MGWALHPTRGGSARFSEKVKDYLTAKFNLGERSGLKADPAQVALDMRTARDESNTMMFTREEWLTKTQVQGYFSCLAAKRRTPSGEKITPEDLVEEEIQQGRREFLHTIEEKLSLQHPIIDDIFCLCDYVKEGKIGKFDISMLKKILQSAECHKVVLFIAPTLLYSSKFNLHSGAYTSPSLRFSLSLPRPLNRCLAHLFVYRCLKFFIS